VPGLRAREVTVDPGDLCQPSGPDGEGQARGQARRRAANLLAAANRRLLNPLPGDHPARVLGYPD